MKKEKKYSGVVVPMLTPFTSSGGVDLMSAERIIDNFISKNVFPFVLGTTGEASSIPYIEKLRFVEFVGKKFSGKTLLYTGISGNCVSESIQSAKEFIDLGSDVIVANLPSYYQLTPDQMLKFFENLADSISRPLIIYNITATTHMSIPLNIVEKLSYHPNIVALKDSERDQDRLDKAIDMFRDRDDFSHLIGWAAKSSYGLSRGSDGLVPSTGNLTPGMFKMMYDAVREGNLSLAERMQTETDLLASVYQSNKTLGESLAAAKILMSEFSLCEEYVLPPLTKLDRKNVDEIKFQLIKLQEKIEFY